MKPEWVKVTGYSASELAKALEIWTKSPMRDIVLHELKTLTDRTRTKVDTASAEDLKGIQGEIKGTKQAIAILDSLGKSITPNPKA